ncbi:MAG: pyridoxamine 5'-phosphate oxidase family protein [Paracoccaceae bacterium]|jgi:hypothetical protein|nr:pyridoxamine 5'-phosphate oxidase family protein [Paracoccaceae bacterium]MDP7185655.1 pyridoxamine 5'-phosphate oxidase family protein [Paracoccaceae bacterium]
MRQISAGRLRCAIVGGMDSCMTNPIKETDDAARSLASGLIADARMAALATLPLTGGFPMVTRVAVALIDGQLVTLVSDIAEHSQALSSNPACSLLIAAPVKKGDPLAHPRITVYARAEFRGAGEKESLRSAYLERHPKAELYYDFADFRLVRFTVDRADLNGGFGKAYRLGPDDLKPV